MHIELIDALRCTAVHEDSWLVGRFDHMEGRDVRGGMLGCPVCRAEYPIRNGAVYFDAPEPGPGSQGSASGFSSEEGLRLAAMLGLVDPGGIVLLAGRWCAAASMLEQLAAVRLLLLDPSHIGPSQGESVVVCRAALPVAPASLRAVALDATTATAPLLDSASRALRAGGRLVVPAGSDLPLPGGLSEIARDASDLVAESRPTPPVVPLRKR